MGGWSGVAPICTSMKTALPFTKGALAICLAGLCETEPVEAEQDAVQFSVEVEIGEIRNCVDSR